MAATRREALPTARALIEQLVVERGLRPGDRLPTEGELADELGVGRSSVREAISSLNALGVVEARHGRGTFLRDATLEGLTQSIAFWSRIHSRDGDEAVAPVRAVRRALEIGMARDAVAAATPASIERLAAAVEAIEAAAREGRSTAEADLEFHLALYEPLENWILLGLVNVFWELRATSTSGREVGADREGVAAAHRALLEVVVAHDLDGAASAMAEHFDAHGL